MTTTRFFKTNGSIIAYSLSLAALLFLLRWLELRFILLRHSFEIYAGIIAILFTALGIWVAGKLSKPTIETVIIKEEVFITRNEAIVPDAHKLALLGISPRELQILQLMAKGYSNSEIASQLFVSLSTVKTHNQNLFQKLDVQRRTQAVQKGRQLHLIP